MTLRISPKLLSEIVAASVEDAIEMSRLEDEAERERVKQSSIEDRIASTAGAGKDDPDSMGKEADAPTRGDNASLDMPGREPPEQAEPQARQSQQPDAEDIDAGALIDKFNIIRSGRSMNDRDISTAMTKLINAMRPEARSALFSALSQVGKIVAPTVDATRLNKPPEEPTAVQAARLQMLQKRRQDREQAADKRAADVSNAVVDEPAPQRSERPPPEDLDEPKRGAEDLSPPIRVGRRTAESAHVRMKQLLQD